MSMNFLRFISWKTAFMVDENWGGRDQHVNFISVEHFAMPIYGGYGDPKPGWTAQSL
jgi:hypothetical protein